MVKDKLHMHNLQTDLQRYLNENLLYFQHIKLSGQAIYEH